MKDLDPTTPNIQFRKVYLSDLNVLVRISQQYSKAPIGKPLTSHFGFPLSIAIALDEVIGFAFASINEMDEVILNAHCLKGEDAIIGARLKLEAEGVLEATFADIKTNRSPLKNSIEQLVDWLNICSN